MASPLGDLGEIGVAVELMEREGVYVDGAVATLEESAGLAQILHDVMAQRAHDLDVARREHRVDVGAA